LALYDIAENIAKPETKRRFGYQTDGTDANAFQHSYWHAEMTIQFGNVTARWVGENHERSCDAACGKWSESDLRNNELGITLGSDLFWNHTKKAQDHKWVAQWMQDWGWHRWWCTDGISIRKCH
jgi:hypothetical protein